MSPARAVTAVLLAGLGASSLSACAGSPTAGMCVDWVWFDTPADAAADADAIVRGAVTGRASSMSLYGQEVTVWQVEVAEWQKGEGDPQIDVVSVPATCESGAPYPDGDPMAADGDVLLLLRADGPRWQTLTPYQGVLPATPNGALPTEWP